MKRTKTINFIYKHQVRKGNKVTDISYEYACYPLKEDLYWVRITVGRDKLKCNGNPRSLVENLLEIKIILNSIILDMHHRAQFMHTNIKDYFLATLMNI